MPSEYITQYHLRDLYKIFPRQFLRANLKELCNLFPSHAKLLLWLPQRGQLLRGLPLQFFLRPCPIQSVEWNVGLTSIKTIETIYAITDIDAICRIQLKHDDYFPACG